MPTRSSKPHRDANQAAKHILDQLTGEVAPDTPKVAATRVSGARGGSSRAGKLTPEQRCEIARLGAQARWKKTP